MTPVEIIEAEIESFIKTNESFKNVDKTYLKETVLAVMREDCASKKLEIKEIRKRQNEIIAEENKRSIEEQADKLLKKCIEIDPSLKNKDEDSLNLFKQNLIAGITDGTIFPDPTA